ncbi:hypothetical protein BC628DRAFT_1345317 [Trametes gibbosa]|nr:hypothetical protein BC628DRAFT_1345317 [Trametes gibbosa]
MRWPISSCRWNPRVSVSVLLQACLQADPLGMVAGSLPIVRQRTMPHLPCPSGRNGHGRHSLSNKVDNRPRLCQHSGHRTCPAVLDHDLCGSVGLAQGRLAVSKSFLWWVLVSTYVGIAHIGTR